MIAIANDHSALEMKKEIMSLLDEMGLEYKDFGAYSSESCNYPGVGARAARAGASGEYEFGILLCGTGLGMSIAANKVRGAYAALISDCYSAERARRSNNANIACIGAFTVGSALAKKLADTFLTSEYTPGTPSEPKVAKKMELDEER